MTLYHKIITVPKNTPKDIPIKEEITVDEYGYIVFTEIRFPPGPQGLLKVSVWYGETQLIPQKESDWIAGDDERIWDIPLFYITKGEKILVKAYNEDDTYDHSFFFRMVVLPSDIVRPLFELGDSIRSIKYLSSVLRMIA